MNLNNNNESYGNVLVVDDEKNIVTVLKALLEKRGFTVDGFTSVKEALDGLRKKHYDAAITDLYMPEVDGMAFLAEARRLYPGTPVVMITAFGTVDSAVDAIKKGAFDYVTKPFEQSEIVSVVQKAVNTSRLNRLDVEPSEAFEVDPELLPLLRGESAAAEKLRELVRKASPSPSSVLITGDTGTGKERIAEEIHRNSDRSFQDLVKINCAAVSSINIEQELFGSQKAGKLELADKGTIFIDEVSELSEEAQEKLMSFLETGGFINPVTGEKVKADVRVIAGNRGDLKALVAQGKFREDLFYKLGVIPILLPTLKERREDLPAIVDGLLKRLNHRLNKAVKGVEKDCMSLLRELSWHGNFRQLENTLERMVVLAKGSMLTSAEVPEEIKAGESLASESELSNFREIVKRQTQNLEKELIERALEEMDGNVTRTAEYLGISRKGLQLKMKDLGVKGNG